MYSVRNWIGVGAAALLAGALTFAGGVALIVLTYQ